MPMGFVVPMPTRLLEESSEKVPASKLRALSWEVNVKFMVPEVEVMDKAPVDIINPFDAVKSPAEVIVPVEVVEMLPEVVTLSPAVNGDRVVPVRVQYPILPVDPPVILPEQVKLPAESMVQPVDV